MMNPPLKSPTPTSLSMAVSMSVSMLMSSFWVSLYNRAIQIQRVIPGSYLSSLSQFPSLTHLLSISLTLTPSLSTLMSLSLSLPLSFWKIDPTKLDRGWNLESAISKQHGTLLMERVLALSDLWWSYFDSWVVAARVVLLWSSYRRPWVQSPVAFFPLKGWEWKLGMAWRCT